LNHPLAAQATAPLAQPFRVLREPPAWALDEAAARAAEDRAHWRARCGGAPEQLELTVFAAEGLSGAGVESRDLRCKIYAQIHYKGLEKSGKHRKASVRASKRGGDCVFLDPVYRTPPNLVLGPAPGGAVVVVAARHKEAFGKKKLIAGLEIPVDILEPNVDTTGWLPMQKGGGKIQLRLRWLRAGLAAPATATAAAAPAVVTGGPVAAPPPPPPPVAVPPPPSGAPAVDAAATPPPPPSSPPATSFDLPPSPPTPTPPEPAKPARPPGWKPPPPPRRDKKPDAPADDAPPARRGSALSASVLGGIAGGAAALKPVDAPADDAPPARRASALSASVLGGIAGGAAALKKAPPPPPPPARDVRASLLGQLNAGRVALKDADDRVLAPPPPPAGGLGLMGAIAARLAERRGSIAMTPMDESDSDSDGDWD